MPDACLCCACLPVVLPLCPAGLLVKSGAFRFITTSFRESRVSGGAAQASWVKGRCCCCCCCP